MTARINQGIFRKANSLLTLLDVDQVY